MPRGGRRIGAGRPRKPIAELKLMGTYRNDRHAHRPETPVRSLAATATVLAPGVPPMPAFLLDGLGDAGRRLVGAIWTAADITGGELELLRQCGRLLDDAEAAGGPKERREAVRSFALILAQLKAVP